ncbi:hypothetical protein D8674_018223 [Pyrus ussuriensis x Pyrus communis]|uniref:PGG domain-containing protein n=1 Tax=Pyrus ussuriensis x Pyrus communis TaxID=2448454 RepID=A0A5N5G8U5_9ROSA|nr:hypothetical protein D8674_018223 [Pyrus ussuriensis x Pyrus communis]
MYLRRDIPHEYEALFAAVKRGDWDEAKGLLTLHPNAITATDGFGTALHSATIFGHEQIVEELVQLMTEEQLEIKNRDGWTALDYAVRENIKMVKCMVTKNQKLLGIATESTQETPIVTAAWRDQWDIVRYLYSLTPPQDLMLDEGIYGSKLVRYCLYAKKFGIAWELLQRYPRFTCTQGTISPIIALASLSSAFASGTSLKLWQKWIYNRIRIELGHSAKDFRINVQNQENEQGNQRNNTVLGLLQALPSRLLEFLGIKRIRELKLIHVRSRQILDCMCDVIKHLTRKEMRDGDVYGAIFVAVENGIVEVVTSLCKARPELLFRTNGDNKNIFQHAVECRQEKVYSLIYGVRQRNLITNLLDDSYNDLLHSAGMLSPLAKLDRIAGAALQMQRERQWYKEVESIHFQLSGSSTKNKDGLIPSKLFTKSHEKLHKEGEKWMKGTSSSCTVVSALIITIMFAAAFTVPGGNNQETVSDAISLFSSATSVLMFLGILTSRYAEDDFLKSLPTKMIIGHSTLFISIATMMVAFSSALFIMLQDKPWITYPIVFLAGVPIILFVWMQFPLLVDFFVSTYGGGIFDRKVKRWINS